MPYMKGKLDIIADQLIVIITDLFLISLVGLLLENELKSSRGLNYGV